MEDVKLSQVHSSSRMDLGIASGMRSGQPTSCSGDFYFGEAKTSSATGRRPTDDAQLLLSLTIQFAS